MLVLSRKAGEQIVIDGRITVTVNRVVGNRVTIGIQAPDSVRIVRGELLQLINEFGSAEIHDAAPSAVPTQGGELPVEMPASRGSTPLVSFDAPLAGFVVRSAR